MDYISFLAEVAVSFVTQITVSVILDYSGTRLVLIIRSAFCESFWEMA